MTYSCVLFDLDGTILDTVSDCRAAINRALSDFSFLTHTDAEVQSYLNNGARMLIRRALPEKVRKDESVIDAVLTRYLRYYSEECLHSSRPYDGIVELLTLLKQNGVALGVVTNKPDEQTRLMIPHYFGNLFDFYEGNSENAPTKPDKRRVFSALSALHKTPDEALFVGDSYVDVQTARNAGLPSIGVAWGFAGKAGFVEAVPDRLVDRPSEIADMVFGKAPIVVR